jgi:hypothetical protein
LRGYRNRWTLLRPQIGSIQNIKLVELSINTWLIICFIQNISSFIFGLFINQTIAVNNWWGLFNNRIGQRYGHPLYIFFSIVERPEFRDLIFYSSPYLRGNDTLVKSGTSIATYLLELFIVSQVIIVSLLLASNASIHLSFDL